MNHPSLIEANSFNGDGMKRICQYEGISVYYDGKTYYCKGVVELNACKLYDHYMSNDHKDLISSLNEILTSAILWGTSSDPDVPKNSPNMENIPDGNPVTTWSITVPFLRTRTYAYKRSGEELSLADNRKAFVITNESVDYSVPISYFAYQVFNYYQQAVLIQQSDNISFVYVKYHDPDTYIPESVCNLALQIYVPYFVKRLYKACEAIDCFKEDDRVKIVNDTLQKGIEEGFVL
eukprot:NODE_8_length_66115_cov_0.981823.p32 type:complete len:235 gc:universal NODE_8_length_66115_cov_0.981823:7719-7015(-)